MRAELSWTGAPGTGAELASALRGWDGLRYEVTEEPSPGCDGARWSYTPRLGIHHAMTSASGDAVVQEDRLREAILRTRGDVDALQDEIDLLLGVPWDEELEVFRYAGDGAARALAAQGGLTTRRLARRGLQRGARDDEGPGGSCSRALVMLAHRAVLGKPLAEQRCCGLSSSTGAR